MDNYGDMCIKDMSKRYKRRLFMLHKRQVLGQRGEMMVKKALLHKGFSIIAMNYRKKCGEIDIIAKHENTIHFIEVKTVSSTRDTVQKDKYNPQDNIHKTKLQRMIRTINTYIAETRYEGDWVIDCALVTLDLEGKLVSFEYIANVC